MKKTISLLLALVLCLSLCACGKAGTPSETEAPTEEDLTAAELAKDSGLNISQLPVVGCAPEWMSEKAVSIGNYVVATGLDTFLGVDPYVSGSDQVAGLLTGGVRDWVEAAFTVEKDLDKLADLMIERIEEKRAALGI